MSDYKRQGNTYGGSQFHPRPHKKSQPNKKGRSKLNTVKISGFRSLKNVNLELNDINILIGANGSGKSNFLSFFEMLGWMTRGRKLQEYISIKGGGDDLLFNGAKTTRKIECAMEFNSKEGSNEYSFRLQHTDDNTLVFSNEEYRFTPTGESLTSWQHLGVGHKEAKIISKENHMAAQVTRMILQKCAIYQFHDTSAGGPFKTSVDKNDNVFLRSNGHNLAAVLLDLKVNHSPIYDEIVNHIKIALPFFGDFELEPLYGKVDLRWVSSKQKDKIFGAHLTSDGTIRFMALVTLLSMPSDRIPDIVLLDEPELGLHPYAIYLITELIKRLGKQKQVVVATQSPLMLNAFEVEHIIVVNEEDGATNLKKLQKDDFSAWKNDFDNSEMWQKNLFGGNP